MTILLIDQTDAWQHLSTLQASDGERRYYLAAAPFRALLVCRAGLRLADLRGQAVDALLGWDRGDPGFARTPGQTQTKITIFGRARGAPARRLSAVLRDAPQDMKEIDASH